MSRNALLILMSIAALSMFQMGGCSVDYSDDDDDDDIEMTIINNHNDDVTIQRDDNFWGWVFVARLDPGEVENVDFDEDDEGDDLRARDGGNTIDSFEVRDGATWSVGGGSGSGGPN